MVWIHPIFHIVNFCLALVAVGIALTIYWRLAGRVATAFKFLIAAIVLFAIKELFILLVELQIYSKEIIVDIAKLGFIILIILATLNIKKVIKEIDGHRKKKKR